MISHSNCSDKVTEGSSLMKRNSSLKMPPGGGGGGEIVSPACASCLFRGQGETKPRVSTQFNKACLEIDLHVSRGPHPLLSFACRLESFSSYKSTGKLSKPR